MEYYKKLNVRSNLVLLGFHFQNIQLNVIYLGCTVTNTINQRII